MVSNDILGLQNTTNLEQEVRSVVGLKNWAIMKSATVDGKIGTLTKFISDVYGIFFNDQDSLDKLSSEIDILTSIPNENYELTDDIVNSIVGINNVIEKDDAVPEEFVTSIKILLLYILELLQSES